MGLEYSRWTSAVREDGVQRRQRRDVALPVRELGLDHGADGLSQVLLDRYLVEGRGLGSGRGLGPGPELGLWLGLGLGLGLGL